MVTGRMKDSSRAVLAPARTELTTPENSTAKATRAIESAASQADRLASVPSVTNTAPTATSRRWAWTRSRIGPPKSTSRSRAKEPNAANVANVASPITFSPNANSAGMTIAVRPARRSAPSPGSWRRSQESNPRAPLMTWRRLAR